MWHIVLFIGMFYFYVYCLSLLDAVDYTNSLHDGAYWSMCQDNGCNLIECNIHGGIANHWHYDIVTDAEYSLFSLQIKGKDNNKLF